MEVVEAVTTVGVVAMHSICLAFLALKESRLLIFIKVRWAIARWMDLL